MAPVGAVVGADAHITVATQLLLEDDPLAGPPADDAGHLDAAGGEPLGHGMHHRRAHAAANADGMTALDELGRLAQGTGDVLDGVPDLQHAEIAAGLAHGLDGEGDGAPLGIGIGDGEGHSLGTFADAHDDELARLAYLRDAAGLDDQASDVGGEDVSLDDWVHQALSACVSTVMASSMTGLRRNVYQLAHHFGGPKVTPSSATLAPGHAPALLALRPVELLLDVELREAGVHEDGLDVDDHVRIAAQVHDGGLGLEVLGPADITDDGLGTSRVAGPARVAGIARPRDGGHVGHRIAAVALPALEQTRDSPAHPGSCSRAA